MAGPLDQLKTQKEVVLNGQIERDAFIRKNSDLRPKLQIRVDLDLSVARTVRNPYVVEGPFDGFFVEATSTIGTTVKQSITSKDNYNLSEYTTLKINSSGTFKTPVRRAILTWTAQAGKTMTIVYYNECTFRPGSTVSEMSGGVVPTTGDTLTPLANVQVTGVATLISAAGAAKKKRTVQVLQGVTIWLGDNTVQAGNAVGTRGGVRIQVGQAWEYTGTGAIYGITNGGNATVSVLEES